MPDQTSPVTVGLWGHQVEALDEVARVMGTTRSDIIRKAVAAYPLVREFYDGVLAQRNGGG